MTTRITTDNITDGTIVKSDLGTITNNSISWQSKITADGSTNTTLEAGKGYFIDTTSNAHTVVLPAAAEVGDTIYIKDYGRTFATNNVTVNRNGHNIDGTSLNATLSTKDTLLQLTYIDSTKGWMTVENEGKILNDPQYISATGGTVTTSGDYKIHTFTSSSTFVVSETGNDLGSNGVDYLVVAGGGGGGTNNNPCSSGGGGGGGAGGYRTGITTYSPTPALSSDSQISVTAQTYPITVGGGGSGQPGNTAPQGDDGSNSVFSTITSTGGGGGGTRFGTTGGRNGGSAGGSGGGGCGASGNTPPVSPPQGNDSAPNGSGGGGASTAGSSGPTFAGGNGEANSITGSSVTYAGGGGGGNGGPGSGGPGGGGDGGSLGPGQSGTAGTANTGGGGGGAGGVAVTGQPAGNGASGGSGIVILRYKYQN